MKGGELMSLNKLSFLLRNLTSTSLKLS